MATSVLIANAALRKIGGETIASFTAGTPEANFINQRYDQTRLWLLETHPWNFATKRVGLARLTGTPVSEFDYFYALPADFLRALAVYDNDAAAGTVEHKIEDNKVVCSASQVWLRYVFDVTDPNSMSALFREALACALAKEAAIDIANSPPLFQLMSGELDRIVRKARSVDSIQDYPDKRPRGSWATSRNGRVTDRSW